MESSSELLNILWITLCSVLVLLMQAAFLCFESGLTRSKNAINVAMKNAADFAVAIFLFWLLGFGLMFGETYNELIGLSLFAPNLGQDSSWNAAFFLFQAMFCTTAATILSGAVAERVRFHGYLLICALVVIVIYPVSGHWAWGGLLVEQHGWLSRLGFVDFAGSSVVHSLGGWVALAAVIIVGARQGRFIDGKPQSIPASNAPLVCLGTLFFVIGWIGFNGGSTLALSHHVPGIITNTILASIGGAITAYALVRVIAGAPKQEAWVAPLNGCLAGLVAITAGCHVVTSSEALFIGSIGAVAMLALDKWMLSKGLDDAIAAVPVHLGAGIWGTLAVALFGDPVILNTGLSFTQQLLAQLIGIVAIGIWAFTIAYFGISIFNRMSPLRVAAEDERDGLNVSEHDARTDLIDLLIEMDMHADSADFSNPVKVEPFTEVGRIADRYNKVMAALADAVNQTKAIVHDIRDAILTFGDDGLLTSFNPAAEQIFNTPAKMAIGQPVHQFLLDHEGKSKPSISPLPQLEINSIKEIRGLRPNNDPFHMEVTLSRGTINGKTQYTALCRDIDEKRKIQEQLYQQKEQAIVTLSSIADGVITTDQAGKIIYLNSVAESLTGWSLGEARGRLCPSVYQTHDPGGITSDNLTRRALNGETIRIDSQNTILKNRQGEDHAITHAAAPIKDSKNRVIGCVIVFHDVTSSRNLQEKLSHQATHDALTSLFNRVGFERAANDLIMQAKQSQEEHILGYLDLDQFKLVNDSCGHVAGDELLRQIARVIKDQLRSGDTIARLGGDEFGILLHNCPKRYGIQIVENIRAAIQAFRFPWQGRQFAIGVSIGLVKINSESPNLPRLLGLADSACYAAKDQGRNRVNFYEPDNLEMAERRGQIQWVSKIRHALDHDKFRLYYQPINPINQTQGGCSHFEIFVRMIDDQSNIIPPGAFIPAAERYNLIQEIDLWVIRNALAWIGDYHKSSGKPLELCAINISGPSISSDDCLKSIITSLETHSVPGERICFEITETAAISNLDSARKFFDTLRKKGCQFALDDFGAGLSSFGYLKNLPVDYLKIDGSFIKNIHRNNIDSVMVQSIITIGHEMGLKTIAEFVENQEVLEHLRQLNVDYVQGYHVGTPAPLEELGGVIFMPR